MALSGSIDGLSPRSYSRLCEDADNAQQWRREGVSLEEITQRLSRRNNQEALHSEIKRLYTELSGLAKTEKAQSTSDSDGPSTSEAVALLSANGIFGCVPSGYINRKTNAVWMQLQGVCPLHQREHSQQHCALVQFFNAPNAGIYCPSSPKLKRTLKGNLFDTTNSARFFLLKKQIKLLEEEYERRYSEKEKINFPNLFL